MKIILKMNKMLPRIFKDNKTITYYRLMSKWILEGNVLNLSLKPNSFDILIKNFTIDLIPEETFDIIADKYCIVI